MSVKLFAALGAMLVAITPLAASAQPHRDHRGADHRAERGYGNWDRRWGAQPPAPPRHWSKKGDWYRHVRACQQRYRNYNPRTDTFEIRRGVTRRCAL
jgi:hypothetical protein